MNSQTSSIIVLAMTCFLLQGHIVHSQKEREIIIIEKTIDLNGNEVSRKTSRKSGQFSDEDVEKMLEDAQLSAPKSRQGSLGFDSDGAWDIQSLFNDRWMNSDKPRLGISTKSTPTGLQVVSVNSGSTAAKGDIRVGDFIVAIDDILIATNEDIVKLLDQHKPGDKVRLLVIRDGVELPKEIELKASSPFDFRMGNAPDIRLGEHYGQSDLEDLFAPFQELFEDFRGEDFFNDRLFDGENDPPFFDTDKNTGKREENRAGLGAFVEMSSEGLIIVELTPNGSAQYGGLLPGDIILYLDGTKITSIHQISQLLSAKSKGDIIHLTVKQKEEIKDLDIQLR